jgi:hypothetical protein
MQISTGQMKQTRIVKMQKGVIAAGRALDNKARELYGEPRFIPQGKKGAGEYSKASPYRAALITLTYAPGVDWQPDHIAKLLTHYRNWFKRNAKGHPFLYVWTVELQQRGIPHYHIVVWLPRGVVPPLPDSQGWWPHGKTNAIYARSPVGYIAKYASKGENQSGHHLPPRCRLWGHGGLTMVERGEIAFATCPRWLKGVIHHEAHPIKKSVEVLTTLASGKVEVIKRAAWVLKAGLAAGWAFFSPFDFDGFSESGITLRHLGVIEALTPDGDSFLIAHS